MPPNIRKAFNRLKLAWDARVIACSECQTAMPVDEAVMQALRRQAADAMATIDGLTLESRSPPNN